jgi:hypothetical protein
VRVFPPRVCALLVRYSHQLGCIPRLHTPRPLRSGDALVTQLSSSDGDPGRGGLGLSLKAMAKLKPTDVVATDSLRGYCHLGDNVRDHSTAADTLTQ